MISASPTWTAIDPALPLLTCHYKFGPGEAHALAVGGSDGLVVISPPAGATEATFADLERRGNVRALVAANAFHHMGLAPWKQRFPEAELFAPAQSIARVVAKTKLEGIRPLSDAAALAGPNVDLIDMPHYKTGEVLVRVRASVGVVWYVVDVIFNLPFLPPKFPFNVLFRLTNSAPGLKRNGIASLFMMRDKRAVYRWLREELAKAPPSLLIPSHGDPLTMNPPGETLSTLLASL